MHIRGLAVSRLLINFMVEMQQTEPTEVEVVVMTRTVEMEWSKFSCVTGHDSGHFEWSLLPAASRKSKKTKAGVGRVATVVCRYCANARTIPFSMVRITYTA